MRAQGAFIQLDIHAYDRIAHAVELDPTLQSRLGVDLCPSCGDLHPRDRMCATLCVVLGPLSERAGCTEAQ